MAAQEAQAEPSMEEILASIRRIISEEDQPAGKAEPVLELTQPASAPPEDDLMVFEEEAPAPKAPEPVAAAPPPAPVAAAPAPAPAPASAPPTRPVEIAAPPIEADEPIISEPAAAIAASAFTRLAGNLRVSDAAGQTLEGMIRQLVRPMLKEWLDQNLPAIVEAKVEAEMERIARLSR